MKRGGSLDNSTMVLVVIVVLNAIAYISVRDWKATGILIFAGLASTVVENKCLVLFIGMLVAALSRSVYIEGMEVEKEKKEKKATPEGTSAKKGDATTLQGSSLEGLSQQAQLLGGRQKELFAMAKELGPMMKQAESMMNRLPKGFLSEAMKNFNKSKE
jgi:hypothetical protein